MGSFLNMVFISLERYQAIVHPIQYRSESSQKKTYIVLASVWLMGFVLTLTECFSARLVDGECITYYTLNDSAAFAIQIYYVSVDFIGISIMVYSYCYVIYFLKRSNKAVVGSDSKSEARDKAMANALNILHICLILTISYLLSVIYLNIIIYIHLFGNVFSSWGAEYYLSVCLVLFNNGLNPIVYLLKYREFQKEFLQLFCSCFRGPATQGFRNSQRSITKTSEVVQ